MIKVKAAIFDMDGTILDSMPVWLECGEWYLKKLGIRPEPGLGKKLLSLTMEDGLKYLKEHYELKLSDKEIYDGVKEIIFESYEKMVTFKPDAENFLTRLKESGTKIALCTNTDRILFDPAFNRLGAHKFFDVIHTTSEMGMTKENPEVFFSIAEELNFSPEETWVFEDALYSIKTADKAGFNTAGIYDKSFADKKEIIKKYTTAYFENYKEAEQYFFN